MRNFFALTAAGAFFLIVLIGYFSDSSLPAMIIRGVSAYLVILVLGEVFVRILDQNGFSPTEGHQAQDVPEKTDPGLIVTDKIAKMNQEIARDPEQVAKTIKGMMK